MDTVRFDARDWLIYYDVAEREPGDPAAVWFTDSPTIWTSDD